MKKVIIITLVFSVGFLLHMNAQQDAQYTQYMYNTITVNPAYAGTQGVFSITALNRSQWVGLDGAPKTQTLNLNTAVSERVGVGFSVVNDEIGNGTNQDTYFDVAVSYAIPTGINGNLSFGLKAGGHFLNVDFNQLRNFQNQGSPIAPQNIDKKFSPNFGMGVYYYTDKFYAGLSVPNFLQTEHFDRSGTTGGTSFLAQELMNWYLISGYVFDLNSDLRFKPAILMKAVQGAPLQVDLSANFLYKEKFSFGAAYRWSAATSALVGMQLSEQFMVGLAYDREISALGGTQFNGGSFEILLRYDFKNKFQKSKSQRFF